MKILFITNNYTPYAGGVVSSINATMAQLKKEGHSVELITFSFLPSHDDPSYIKRIPSIARFRYKTHYAAIPLWPAQYIKDRIEALRPDLIHVHHPFLLGALGAREGKRFGIPVVFTYHTQYEQFPIYVPLPKSLTSYLVSQKVVRFCKSVQGIIAVGRIVTSFLKKHAIQTPTIELASGLQEHFLLPLVQKKIGKQCNLLLVSRFSEEKNIPFLIDMLSLLPKQFTLSLVGFGPLFNEMQEYAQQRGVSSRTTFIHKPAKERLIACYQKAHIFLFAAQQSECQPQVLPEAFSAGLPIVALPGPGPDECIVNGNNGYVVESKKEMVDRITVISKKPDLYAQLQQNAWNAAQAYHPSTQVKKLISFYTRVIKNQKLLHLVGNNP